MPSISTFDWKMSRTRSCTRSRDVGGAPPTTLRCSLSASSHSARASSRLSGGVVDAATNDRPKNRCKSTRKPISSFVRMECATPDRPARATRPTRCTKSFGRGGKSKFTTLSNSGMSIPRAATSVTTKTSLFRARNFPMLILRAAMSMEPYTALHLTPSSSNTAMSSSTW
eukprot:31210-Pelagococcus_subviridis.AAC.18